MPTLSRGTFASGTSGAGTTVATSGTVVHTAGRLLVAMIAWETAGVLSSVADVALGSWSILGQVNSAADENGAAIAYCLSTPGSAVNVVTATFSSALSESHTIAVQEYFLDVGGTWSAGAFQTNSGSGTAFTTPSFSVRAQEPGCGVVATFDLETFTPNGNWTSRADFASDTAVDQLVSSPASFGVDITGNTSTSWAAVGGTFTNNLSQGASTDLSVRGLGEAVVGGSIF